ncbi:MAG: hypothetical protein QXY49_03485 [Thermofilaceae archaeon]
MPGDLKLRIHLSEGSLELCITAKKIDKVFPHEEVVPAHLDRLKLALLSSPLQRNPIIIDSASGLILDGTHRWAAMHDLGYRWIVVCEVDYNNPLIVLDRWVRAYKHIKSSLVEEIAREFEAEPVERNKVENEDLILGTSSTLYRVNYTSVEEAFTKLHAIEKKLLRLYGYTPSYIASGYRGKVEEYSFFLVPPLLSKNDVVKLARKGFSLPPKSTRHLVPARPLSVNVPLKLLIDESLDFEALGEILRQRNPVLLKPPIRLDRDYQELVLYFI